MTCMNNEKIVLLHSIREREIQLCADQIQHTLQGHGTENATFYIFDNSQNNHGSQIWLQK